MRAGIGKHFELAEDFMRRGCEQWDSYRSYLSQATSLIARRGLYALIFDSAKEVDNLPLMKIMARNLDWVHDMLICAKENAEMSRKLAGNFEYRARIEWDLANGGREHDAYKD